MSGPYWYLVSGPYWYLVSEPYWCSTGVLGLTLLRVFRRYLSLAFSSFRLASCGDGSSARGFFKLSISADRVLICLSCTSTHPDSDQHSQTHINTPRQKMVSLLKVGGDVSTATDKQNRKRSWSSSSHISPSVPVRWILIIR